MPVFGIVENMSYAGTPIVASQPDSGHARAFKAVVARLAEKIDGTLAASAAAAARIIVE